MFRLLAAVTLSSVAVLPALAQPSLRHTHVEASGAVAGRSPHRAYRPIAAAPACGGPAMHSIPAGKGHVFGTHAFAGAPCAPAQVAAAGASVLSGQE